MSIYKIETSNNKTVATILQAGFETGEPITISSIGLHEAIVAIKEGSIFTVVQ